MHSSSSRKNVASSKNEEEKALTVSSAPRYRGMMQQQTASQKKLGPSSKQSGAQVTPNQPRQAITKSTSATSTAQARVNSYRKESNAAASSNARRSSKADLTTPVMSRVPKKVKSTTAPDR